jgi:hypothetical protein
MVEGVIEADGEMYLAFASRKSTGPIGRGAQYINGVNARPPRERQGRELPAR